MIKAENLFDLTHTIARELIESCDEPYQALPKIKEEIEKLSGQLDGSFKEISEGVFVADDAVIFDSATILPPTIIGHKTEVRPGAFIRGCAIIGDGVVVGNSTEIKNAIIFDGVQIPHYNYVGDSILGYKSHMGAGAIASNFRLDHGEIKICDDEGKRGTGLRKMGVLLGDFAEVGCNSVLCPGSIVGRHAVVFPLSCVIGSVAENSVFNSHKASK